MFCTPCTGAVQSSRISSAGAGFWTESAAIWVCQYQLSDETPEISSSFQLKPGKCCSTDAGDVFQVAMQSLATLTMFVPSKRAQFTAMCFLSCRRSLQPKRKAICGVILMQTHVMFSCSYSHSPYGPGINLLLAIKLLFRCARSFGLVFSHPSVRSTSHFACAGNDRDTAHLRCHEAHCHYAGLVTRQNGRPFQCPSICLRICVISLDGFKGNLALLEPFCPGSICRLKCLV